MHACCGLLWAVGQEEVEAAVRLLDEEGRKLARSRLQYKLMPAPLYAGAQTAVLDPTVQVGFQGVDMCCSGYVTGRMCIRCCARFHESVMLLPTPCLH